MLTLILPIALAQSPPGPAVPDEAYWQSRTDPALHAAIEQACTEAASSDKAVLLSFSAPWCIDSRTVASFETETAVRQELDAHWVQVVVDVGRFDAHDALRSAMEVERIATWVALSPQCDAPVTAWPVLGREVLEPASHPTTVRSADDLAEWLRTARARATRP